MKNPTVNNFNEIICRAAADDPAYVTFWQKKGNHEVYRYDDVLDRARRIASGLIEKGLSPKDRVVIVLPTGIDFYDIFFGCMVAGIIPCALYPPVRLGRLDEWKVQTARMITGIGADLVVTNRRIFNLLGSSVAESKPKYGCTTVSALFDRSVGKVEVHLPAPYDIAFIQYSSGSTGFPKPVAISHKNIVVNTSAILASFPLTFEQMSCTSWLPLYHDMGLVGTVMCGLVTNRPVTLLSPELFITAPIEWLRAISSTRSTITVAPNFAYSYCVHKIDKLNCSDLDLSSLKIALCGSEMVSVDTLKLFSDHFYESGLDPRALTPVYGMAEATLAITFSGIEEEIEAKCFDREEIEGNGRAVKKNGNGLSLVSVGKPLEGVSLQIRGQEGRILEENLVGEVFISGQSVMGGYYGALEETAKAFDGTWLKTGDRGFLHEGNLFICGRFKDIIIINGRNYDPAQIEFHLSRVDGLRKGSAAAFGQFNQARGTEDLILLAESNNGASRHELVELAERTRRFIQQETGLIPCVVEILPKGTLPRTSSGKIRRGETSLRWRRGELTPAKSFSLIDAIKENIRGKIDHIFFRVNGR